MYNKVLLITLIEDGMGYVESGVRGLASGKGATNVPYIEQGIGPNAVSFYLRQLCYKIK